MTRPNLETQLLNDWNQMMADLTPAEREQLAAATPADWFAAIAELVRDPKFWEGIGTAFLEGILKGLQDFNAERR
jgi:hypothetical protein